MAAYWPVGTAREAGREDIDRTESHHRSHLQKEEGKETGNKNKSN